MVHRAVRLLRWPVWLRLRLQPMRRHNVGLFGRQSLLRLRFQVDRQGLHTREQLVEVRSLRAPHLGVLGLILLVAQELQRLAANVARPRQRILSRVAANHAQG